jgi:glycine cleavage system regulatory protein
MIKSLVVTVIGPDRPGLVSLLSDRARGFGANWAASRMASLAGQFAGIVHFEVPAERAKALADALAGLETAGLRVVIAESDAKAPPRNRRIVRLELIGQDRPGIMRDLSGRLAERGVSIDELHTEIASAAMSAESLFKVKAVLVVPATLSDEELRRALEALANEMMVDIALGDEADAIPG